jgi:hypothetical protein
MLAEADFISFFFPHYLVSPLLLGPSRPTTKKTAEQMGQYQRDYRYTRMVVFMVGYMAWKPYTQPNLERTGPHAVWAFTVLVGDPGF